MSLDDLLLVFVLSLLDFIFDFNQKCLLLQNKLIVVLSASNKLSFIKAHALITFVHTHMNLNEPCLSLIGMCSSSAAGINY